MAALFGLLGAVTIVAAILVLLLGHQLFEFSDEQVDRRFGHLVVLSFVCFGGAGYLSLEALLDRVPSLLGRI